ncbi:hypothetical protein [Actinoplanes sp. NPDC049802]|uniref:hypothetical protein n=1 Tax=Actinoplanes sp. NPDC049802 TaxID=3154742 RepID=UPI0033D28390
MSRSLRWRFASVFIGLSGLLLGASVLGAWAGWAHLSPAIRAVTVFMCLLFAACVWLSISIAVVDWDVDFPWGRAGFLLLLLVLGCGVGWARSVLT